MQITKCYFQNANCYMIITKCKLLNANCQFSIGRLYQLPNYHFANSI